MSLLEAQREQTRARYPDEEGYVERDSVRVFYEVYGDGEPTVFLLPTWSIIHSRHWKLQIPYFARHFRVLTFDGRGNGKADRPQGVAAYTEGEFAADSLAVMDATGTETAVIVGLSCGALWGTLLAADHPDRVLGAVFIGPAVPLAPGHPERNVHSFYDRLDTDEGWARYNRYYWLEHHEEFLEYFFGRIFSEPHSTKQIEDCVGWGLEMSPENADGLSGRARALWPRALPRRLRAGPLPGARPARRRGRDQAPRAGRRSRRGHPRQAGHARGLRPLPPRQGPGEGEPADPRVRREAGKEDAMNVVTEPQPGFDLGDELDASVLLLEGSGHAPHVRDPVEVNHVLADLAGLAPGPRRWVRGRSRPRRALYVSSPIGLGHARRDVAIAKELRRLVPDLQIDWLAQHPVTTVLEAEGERIHPASAELANESGHIESESAEHDLHAFQAIRRMDEILCANFMLFHDIVEADQYDLWIGDEAWEIDYYLHENPELKRAAYVWLTDFVGWLPLEDGGEREAFLTADYNAEMIEHIARFPRVRDRALFVGNPDDVVGDSFGPGLPAIRDWTQQHYDFAGYVSGFDPAAFADREKLRAELGYAPGEQVCIVTVGGSGVGGHLLRRVVDAFPEAKELVPELRMIVVAGPRIDPAAFPEADGLEVRAYVHNLYRHLAACDLAVVQGGLTTSMELTANRRPFLYFPLRHHFEQNFHVRHRLGRYGAGRAMDFETATPDVIAQAIAEEIGREVDYKPVETDGAAKAAASIAELL
jgi:pimeloyl-ACP methyl ester carboxylesterase/predicted glycosyltransferase